MTTLTNPTGGAARAAPLSVPALNVLVPDEIYHRLFWLSDAVRSMGIHVMAGKGSGKSRLMGRVIAWQDFVRGTPQVILDPNGATIDNFFSRLVLLPKAYQERLWRRVLYCDMSGKHGYVVPFPIFYRLGNETYNDIASRYLDVLFRLDPKLADAPVLGMNAVTRVGRRAGIILAALGYQITEMPHLLDHPEQWLGPLASLSSDQPEAREAAAFFLRDYLCWQPRERELGAGSLRVKLDPFVLDPTMRAMFGPAQPGIHWPEVIEKRQTVLLDFRHELNHENRRFKMLWAFRYFLEFIKHRGLGRHQPVGLVIDEITALYNFDVAAGHSIFAADLDELINVIARNYSVWLTLAHQELFQLDEKSRKTLMTMGTQIVGVTTDFDAALTLGREFIPVDPWRIKRYEKVIVPTPRFSLRLSLGEGPEIMDLNPVELSVQEQEYLAAYLFKNLQPFQFLVKVPQREGDHTGHLKLVSIANLDNGIWNDENLLKELRPRLSRRAGLPIDTLLAAIDRRTTLLSGRNPQPALGSGGTLKADAQPSQAAPSTLPPAPDEDESTFRGDPAEMIRLQAVIFPPPKQQQATPSVVLPDKSAFHLTDRDQEIVCSVFDYRVLTTHQIARLHFSSSTGEIESVISRCRTRLRYLTEAGFLRRFEQAQTLSEGRKPYCFVCTEKGAQLVATLRDLTMEELHWTPIKKPSLLFLDHLLASNDIRMAAMFSAKKHGWSIPIWYDESMLRSAQMKDYVTITSSQGEEKRVAVIADGYFCFATETHPYFCFLEIDRGTVTGEATKWENRDWSRKVLSYLTYYHSGQYEARYQTKSLRILTITTTEKRLATLKEATEKAGGRSRFWFTTQEKATTADILTDPIWQKAGQSGTFALAC